MKNELMKNLNGDLTFFFVLRRPSLFLRLILLSCQTFVEWLRCAGFKNFK